jgi:hypothetical protein
MLGDMCGDLPEDFRNMCDRRESYNRPLKMKRSEMGIREGVTTRWSQILWEQRETASGWRRPLFRNQSL